MRRSALTARPPAAPLASPARHHSRRRSWVPLVWLIGSLGVSLGSVSTAVAAQAATVLPIKMVGSDDTAAQAILDAAVTRALREQRLLDVAASERDAILTSEPKLAGCLTEPCMERIGRLLDSQLVLRAQATFSAPGANAPAASSAVNGDWELKTDVFDVEVGAVGASLHVDCRACSVQRAGQALSELVGRAVLESASRPRGYLAINSVPPNAIVFVDAIELGFTPYKRLTFVGNHRIAVRSTGFRSYQGEVVIEESKKQQVIVTLQAGVDDPVVVEKKATPIYKKWWFWTIIGGAAAVAAGGITAGVLLGRGSANPNGTPGPVHIQF